MLRGDERVYNRAAIVAFEPSVRADRSFALAVRTRIHQSSAIAGAKQEQRVFQNTLAVVGDAVKQLYPRTIRLRGSHFPAAQQNSVPSANVKCFAVNADLREGSIGLLDEVGR